MPFIPRYVSVVEKYTGSFLECCNRKICIYYEFASRQIGTVTLTDMRYGCYSCYSENIYCLITVDMACMNLFDKPLTYVNRLPQFCMVNKIPSHISLVFY